MLPDMTRSYKNKEEQEEKCGDILMVQTWENEYILEERLSRMRFI